MLPTPEFLSRIFDTGIVPGLSQSEMRRTRLLNKICIAISITLLVYIPLELFFKMPLLFVLYTGISALLALSCLLLNHRRQYRAAKIAFMCFATLSTSASSILLGSEIDARYILISGAVLPLILFRNLWHNLLWVAISFIAYCAVTVLQEHIPPAIIIDKSIIDLSNYIMVFTTFLLIFLLTMYFKNDNEKYEQILQEQNTRIEEKNREITSSISYAKRLQEAILPPIKHIQQVLPSSFILYRPKDIVAGDFYWLEEQDGKTLFAVADCTGHGVPGAMVSVVCSNAMHRAVKEAGLTDPGKILDKVTELVVRTFEKSESAVKDGMDISLCCLHKSTLVLEWAGANNPLWIVKKDGNMIELKPDKQPVGMFHLHRPFTTHTLQLEKGDRIYIFSDGFADQFGGPKGKKFKYGQLKETILAGRHLSPAEQEARLDKVFREWKGDLEQVDDVCIMCVEV